METHVIRLLCEAYDSLEEAQRETGHGFVSDFIAVALSNIRKAITSVVQHEEAEV